MRVRVLVALPTEEKPRAITESIALLKEMRGLDMMSLLTDEAKTTVAFTLEQLTSMLQGESPKYAEAKAQGSSRRSSLAWSCSARVQGRRPRRRACMEVRL